MTHVNSAAIRLFILGTLLWCLPGVIPPLNMLGMWYSEAKSIASWLGTIAATVCFVLAYRRAVEV